MGGEDIVTVKAYMCANLEEFINKKVIIEYNDSKVIKEEEIEEDENSDCNEDEENCVLLPYSIEYTFGEVTEIDQDYIYINNEPIQINRIKIIQYKK